MSRDFRRLEVRLPVFAAGLGLVGDLLQFVTDLANLAVAADCGAQLALNGLDSRCR